MTRWAKANAGILIAVGVCFVALQVMFPDFHGFIDWQAVLYGR